MWVAALAHPLASLRSFLSTGFMLLKMDSDQYPMDSDQYPTDSNRYPMDSDT